MSEQHETEERKVCPLFYAMNNSGGEYTLCFGEGCAWWDKLEHECAILIIARGGYGR